MSYLSITDTGPQPQYLAGISTKSSTSRGIKILAEDALLASRMHIPKIHGLPGPLQLCPNYGAFLALRTRIHSGFSSSEMWSNLRSSQEHRRAQRSNGCWRPDQDPTPTGYRRASGLRSRSWMHHPQVWEGKWFLRKEAEPWPSISVG